eukprot:8325246-Pyramimonas_sp.AAC.1
MLSLTTASSTEFRRSARDPAELRDRVSNALLASTTERASAFSPREHSRDRTTEKGAATSYQSGRGTSPCTASRQST